MRLDGLFKAEKLNQVIVGYDLGNTTSQISYRLPDQDAPETAAVVAGEEKFNFPTMLGKRHEINQWVFGLEAQRLESEKKGIAVRGLFAAALEGKNIEVDGEFFDPVALLTLFVKRSFSLISGVCKPDEIGALMITVENLDHRCIEVLSTLVAGLRLKTEIICFQSHTESFYHYTVHQEKELWLHDVILCDFGGASLKSYCLECNRRTSPIVAFVDENVHEDLKAPHKALTDNEKVDMDASFTAIMKHLHEGRILSCVYLIGEGFNENWYKGTVRYLCRTSRVFLGNNLYSKGACYAMAERLGMDTSAKDYVFLGNEKLKSNIGMKVLRQGKPSYYVLLDAGINWFEAYKECEFILEDGYSFSIMITPLTGREVKEVEILLDDMPKRRSRATKVSLRISLKSESVAEVAIEDLGFGQIYEATHKTWTKELVL